MRRIRNLSDRLWELQPNSDNLHLIAIHNLEDENAEKMLKHWWRSRYKAPLKAYDDYVFEELFVEMLEDYYDKAPAEKNRRLYDMELRAKGEWDGRVEYDEQTQKRLKKFYEKNKVDISKYKEDRKLTEKEEEKLMENLGRKLPDSKKVEHRGKKPAFLGSDEFEDVF